jgi:hypothetical protein
MLETVSSTFLGNELPPSPLPLPVVPLLLDEDEEEVEEVLVDAHGSVVCVY